MGLELNVQQKLPTLITDMKPNRVPELLMVKIQPV